jgi:hypothetical protein
MDADPMPKPAQSGRRPDPVRRAGKALAANWELAALCCWAAPWFVILARHGGIAWDYFVQGSSLIFSGHDGASAHPGGLHIYANYPELQIGPLAFRTAQLIRLLGPGQGLVLAELVMAAMGLVALYVIRRVTLTVRPELAGRTATRWTFLSGGAVFVITWQQLAVYFGHLDDALALLAALLALWAAVSRRPVLTGLLAGLSVDAKPWALIFLPILLLAGGTDLRSSGSTALRSSGAAGPAGSGGAGRRRLRAVAIAAGVAAAVIAAAWLPFFVADPGTLTAARYTIVNLPDSALRALGVHTPKTPSWDRAAQAATGCALGAAAIWRRRWAAVILLGVGARIALDPAAHAYYTAGVMLGALTWDMVGSRRPLPLWSIASFGALTVVPLVTKDAHVQGTLRLALVIAFTVVILAGPGRWCWSPPDSGSSPPRSRLADAVQGRR